MHDLLDCVPTIEIVMIIFRWILFLPAAALLFALAQSTTGIIAESLAWWISMPLVLIFGVLIAISAYIPCGMICPNPKTGSTIVLTLFIFLEGITFISSFKEMTWPTLLIRLYTDVVLVFGTIGAATQENQATINSQTQ